MIGGPKFELSVTETFKMSYIITCMSISFNSL